MARRNGHRALGAPRRLGVIALLATLLPLDPGVAATEVPSGAGHLLKPEKKPMLLKVYEDRLEFFDHVDHPGAPSRPGRLAFQIKRDEVRGLRYESGERSASEGAILALGLVAAFAKRTMTTIGIEKTDSEIVVFRMKGKDRIDVLIALDRFMGVEQREASGDSVLRCDHGHEWPVHPDFRFCPRDGAPLREVPR